ncbi:hypothetical protein DENSPDRAFT_85292 [Dentipellis sp. KUC8613]|nr:hypothetical protein DENSPDRAFT_85292 [Dentipellis sp. KUC8613]
MPSVEDIDKSDNQRLSGERALTFPGAYPASIKDSSSSSDEAFAGPGMSSLDDDTVAGNVVAGSDDDGSHTGPLQGSGVGGSIHAAAIKVHAETATGHSHSSEAWLHPAGSSHSLGHVMDSHPNDNASGNSDENQAQDTTPAMETNPHKSQQKKKSTFGMPYHSHNIQYPSSDDYEQKYPPDEPFKTLDPNARVWKVYLDEAKMMDDDMTEAWRDTVDVLLVFAGLFSAVVTTFVVQSSQSLQTDYSQVSAMLLTELVGLQRAAANGASADTVPMAPQNATSGFQAARSDQWVNRLWFISLAFSLATALMAVLVKQWLQYYVSPISGTAKEKAHTRHYRFAGLEKWHVSGIVGCLPILMHIALLLFFIGLIVFLVPLDKVTAGITGFLTATLYAVYIGTNILPVYAIDCSYKTPVSELMASLIHLPVYLCYKTQRYLYKFSQNREAQDYLDSMIRKSTDNILKSHKEIESIAVKEDSMMLDMESLGWLYNFTSNPIVLRIVIQGVSSADIFQHTLEPFKFTNDSSNCMALVEYCVSQFTQQQSYSHPQVAEHYFWFIIIFLLSQSNVEEITPWMWQEEFRMREDKYTTLVQSLLHEHSAHSKFYWVHSILASYQSQSSVMELLSLLKSNFKVNTQAHYNAFSFLFKMCQIYLMDPSIGSDVDPDEMFSDIFLLPTQSSIEFSQSKYISVYQKYNGEIKEAKECDTIHGFDNHDVRTASLKILDWHSKHDKWISIYEDERQQKLFDIYNSDHSLLMNKNGEINSSKTLSLVTSQFIAWGFHVSNKPPSGLFVRFYDLCTRHTMDELKHMETGIQVNWTKFLEAWVICYGNYLRDEQELMKSDMMITYDTIATLICSNACEVFLDMLDKYSILDIIQNYFQKTGLRVLWISQNDLSISNLCNKIFDQKSFIYIVNFMTRHKNMEFYLDECKYLVTQPFEHTVLPTLWFDILRIFHLQIDNDRIMCQTDETITLEKGLWIKFIEDTSQNLLDSQEESVETLRYFGNKIMTEIMRSITHDQILPNHQKLEKQMEDIDATHLQRYVLFFYKYNCHLKMNNSCNSQYASHDEIFDDLDQLIAISRTNPELLKVWSPGV